VFFFTGKVREKMPRYKIVLIEGQAYGTYRFHSLLAAFYWWVDVCNYNPREFFDMIEDIV
jgi:hypothetical protein